MAEQELRVERRVKSSPQDEPIPLPERPPNTLLTREQRLDAIARIMLKGAEKLLAEREREAAEREQSA